MIEAARLAVLVTDEGTDKVAGNLRGLGDTLENAGKKAALAGGVLSAAITAPLLALGNRAVDAASDMAESMSKVNVVFGDSAGFVADFASRAATNLGITQQLALDTARTCRCREDACA
jgi:hypothetical protein